MTRQEYFNKALTHLRKQSTTAVDKKRGCMYRGPNGTMCAVGCLISDKKYLPEFETHRAGCLPLPFIKGDRTFFNAMQKSLHDEHQRLKSDVPFPVWLEEQAETFAKEWNLTVLLKGN